MYSVRREGDKYPLFGIVKTVSPGGLVTHDWNFVTIIPFIMKYNYISPKDFHGYRVWCYPKVLIKYRNKRWFKMMVWAPLFGEPVPKSNTYFG